MIKQLLDLWRKWGLKAGLSITEQGILSGGSFILNIFLIRWLAPAEYGVFAIAFSVFLFLSGFHNALILEPISVIGISRYKAQFPVYLKIVVDIHCLLSIGFFVIMGLISIAMLMINSVLTSSFFAVAISSPFILFFWLFRRVCYAETKPDLALKGSLFYILLLVLGIIIIKNQNLLTPFSAFIMMALASIVTSTIFWCFLNTRFDNSIHLKNLTIGSVISDHWHYSKWLVGVAFVNWLSLVIYVPLIGIFAGLTQAGVFRAMQNLVLPLERIVAILGILVLPWFSAQHMIQGSKYIQKTLPKMIMINIAIASSYVVLLLLFSGWIVKFLYGQDYYINFLWLLPYLGILAIIESISQGIAIGFRTTKQPYAIFWSQFIGSLLTLTLGLYLGWLFKLYGIVVGSIMTALLINLTLFYFQRKKLSCKVIESY